MPKLIAYYLKSSCLEGGIVLGIGFMIIIRIAGWPELEGHHYRSCSFSLVSTWENAVSLHWQDPTNYSCTLHQDGRRFFTLADIIAGLITIEARFRKSKY